MGRKRRKSDDNAGAGFAVLIVIGLIIHFIWWILGALALVAAYYLSREVVRAVKRRRAERDAHYRAVCARADQQHAWALQGDDRGVFGVEGAKLMREIRSS
jgi:hypothetical protein